MEKLECYWKLYTKVCIATYEQIVRWTDDVSDEIDLHVQGGTRARAEVQVQFNRLHVREVDTQLGRAAGVGVAAHELDALRVI